LSRLTDLISKVKAKDSDLGAELEQEFKVIASRRSFGLQFERHRPESVELPGHPIRKGDKVRILPSRGSTAEGDQRLWKVCSLEGTREEPVERLGGIRQAAGRRIEPLPDFLVIRTWRFTSRCVT
jgi:adenine-specific DNA-methyltransferase